MGNLRKMRDIGDKVTMSIQQKPVIGTWYVNLTGQIMKVWAIGYEGDQIDRVVIEYLNGSRRVVDIESWNRLDLERDFQKVFQNGGSETLQH